MKKNSLLFVSLLVLAIVGSMWGQSPAAAAPKQVFPNIVPLPNGFWPEGVAAGHGTDLYVGSLASGAIYQADVLTGEGEILVSPPEARMAVGLSFDRRSNLLFVAGGTGGNAYVYDTTTGAEVATFDFARPGGFVNDVIVARTAAYFTVSSQPYLYRLPLSPGGGLPDPSAVEEIPLGGDFIQVPGGPNANGIEATASGRVLVVAHTIRGELYRVDPATGYATLIDLGGDSVLFADGLLLIGRTLFVVQNFFNQIAVVELSPDLSSGEIVGTITDPAFRIPTTVTRLGNALYLPNARFDTPPGPDVEYEVVRVSRH